MENCNEKLLGCEVVESNDNFSSKPKARRSRNSTVTGALILSLTFNVIFILRIYSYSHDESVAKSKYGTANPQYTIALADTISAGLINNVDVPYVWDTDRSNPNDTERNKLWYEDEESNEGIMAMDNEEAEMLGLQRSQPWPWDKKKSIHITNGHHNLHCLRNIYISINEYSTGVPQSLERSHVLHCLGALYDDIKCNADDTPRFTNRGVKPGEGQIRKCRDWSQLRKWVKERDGCFKYIKHDVQNISTIERMKYCSNDSKYLPLIREFFGLKDTWFPWPYVEQEGYLIKGEEFRGRDFE